MAAKKAAKKSAAKLAKKSAKKIVKKSSVKKSSVKKKAKPVATKAKPKKATAKKVSAKKVTAKKVTAKKKKSGTTIVIPPVPSTKPVTQTISTTPTSTSSGQSASKQTAPVATSGATKPKSSGRVLFLVIAGIVLLGIFVINRGGGNESATPSTEPTPTVSESITEEPVVAESPAALAAHGAPQKFVALNNKSGGVTLRWFAPAEAEGITGYDVSISYDAKNFTLVSTVPANQLTLDIAKVGDEGGTQFLVQTVYSDGEKVDAKKFALAGKYA